MRLPPGVSKFPQQLQDYLRLYPTLFEAVLIASFLGKGPSLSQQTLLNRTLQPRCVASPRQEAAVMDPGHSLGAEP